MSHVPPAPIKSLTEFLVAHALAKDAPKKADTHLENGNYKRKFKIALEEEDHFEELYYRDVIRPNTPHYLLEEQFMRDGDNIPGTLAIDLDFKFAGESLVRQYTMATHILPFTRALMMEIHRLYDLDPDDTLIRAFILEKPAPRVKNAGTVSDGIHMLIGLAIPMLHHTWLWEKMVAWVNEHWCTATNAQGEPVPTFLNTVNDATSIVDRALMAGNTAWLKYNSRKAGDTMIYKVSHAYEFGIDMDDWTPAQGYDGTVSDGKFGPWVQTDISPPSAPSGELQWNKKHYRELSVRNRKVPVGVTRESMDAELGEFRTARDRTRAGIVDDPASSSGIGGRKQDGVPNIDPNQLRLICDDTSLGECVQLFFDYLSPNDSVTREIWEYTMSLPPEYYAKGSYQKRLNVGFALHHHSPNMLVVYIAFCAQRDEFDFNRVPDICDKWMSFAPRPGGIQSKSLAWWSRTSVPEKWSAIRESTIDYLIEQSLETITIHDVNNPRKKNANGCSDCDKALILYRLASGLFKCASIRGNVWFAFRNHHWMEDDQGTTLRAMISRELRALYLEKARGIMKVLGEATDIESDHYKVLQLRADKVLEIAKALGDRKTKDNVLFEAREMFYDPDFLQNLNTNMYLTCFENGVLDMKAKVFRPGYPEDYITKCTNTRYTPLCEQPPEAIERTYAYLRQVFPVPSTLEYVIDHIASLWFGDSSVNQRLHMYEGVGSNGKSRFVNLLCKMLGTYAVYIEVGFYTQDRKQLGDATPELFAIIGCRLMHSAEPNEGASLVEGPMKQVTGGTDEISARAPYGQLVTFIPQVNPIIQTNNLPKVITTDHGTWRRIARILFLALFTRTPVYNDPNQPYQFPLLSPEKMKEMFEEMKTVLASISIDRAMKTGGVIGMCESVLAASEEYKQDQDIVAAFMSDKIESHSGGVVKHSELRKEFDEWCINIHGTKHLAQRKFKDLTARMDRQYGNTGKRQMWQNASVKYDIPFYGFEPETGEGGEEGAGEGERGQAGENCGFSYTGADTNTVL